MERERIIWLDIVRIAACWLVILFHSFCNVDYRSMPTWMIGSILYFTSCCVPLFYMISGALLLPTDLPAREFMRRRLGRVIIPLFLWTIFYIAFQSPPEFTTGDYIEAVLVFPFRFSGTGDLWFMYPLIGFYLLIPVISPWVRKVDINDFNIYKWLILIAYTVPVLAFYLNVPTNVSSLWFYFMGFGSYFILGWGMLRFPQAFKWSLVLKLWVVSVVALGVAHYCLKDYTDKSIFDDTEFWTIYSMMLTVLAFKAFSMLKRWGQQLSPKTKHRIITISNLTFGVYLCHRLVIVLLWKSGIPQLVSNLFLQMLVYWGLTIIIAWTLTALMALTPFGRLLVGFQFKRSKNQ